MFKTLFISFFLTFFSLLSFGQYAYRIHADILTKTRMPDSTFQISNGKIHYDKNYQKIIFDFTFPEQEKIVLLDTLMYHFRDDSLVKTSRNMLIPDQSVFHFIMSGNLSNFGFENAGFKATSIDKENDLVITTWIPPDMIKEHISKVLVATKEKQLYSITLFDANKQVMNRQILKKYQWIDNIEVPHEILIATYTDSGTMYQIISLKNVKLNEEGNNQTYNYDI
ncbi:MAG: hypothetical protein PF481_04060 [Bacteroidales bacterium]|jgi:hypothetical protein|nr:hypothetical protein [Bacteroidales bacterium]